VTARGLAERRQAGWDPGSSDRLFPPGRRVPTLGAMRPSLRSCVVLALLFAGCGEDSRSGPMGGASAPRGFQGQFHGEGPAGSLTLTLVQTGNVVEITSGGEKAVGRLVAANRVEADTKEGELSGRIVLLLEGDDVRMQTRITDANGESADLPDVVLKRVGGPPPSSGAGAGAGSGSGTRDARLVAHWRNNEGRSSPEVSYSTDTHLILNSDGTFETWDKTVSSLSGTEESAHTTGTWKTEGGALWIKPQGHDGWSSAGKYGLTDTHLMLTDAAGRKTIYERL
jgi:hypothetical protein